MKSKLLFATIFVATVCAIFFWPTDENKIKKNLELFADYCSSSMNDTAIDILKKSALAAKLTNDPFGVKIESLKVDRSFSQKELSDHILILKKRLPNTEFSFKDTRITFNNENSAEVTTTLQLEGKIIDDDFTDAYEINAITEKIDGKWIFSSFVVVEFIKR